MDDLSASLRRETVLYAAATTVSGLVMLAVLPFMSTALTPGQAGEVGSLRSIADVFGGIAVLGLPAGLLKYWQDGSTDRRRLLLMAILLPAAACAVLAAALIPVAGSVAGLLRLSSPGLLVHGVLLGAATALVQVVLTIYRGDGRAWSYFTIQSARGIASVLLLAILVWEGISGVSTFLLARWAPALAAAAVAAVMAVSFSRSGGAPPNGLMRFSLPLVPAGLALLVLSSADMLMLRAMDIDPSESGFYEWASTAALALTPFTLGFGMAWQRHIFREGRPDYDALGRSSLRFILVALEAAMLLALASPEIVSIVGGEEYLPAARVLPMLAGANALYAFFLVAQTGPMLSGRTWWIAFVTIIGAAANIVFNARLIPLFGATGAALATLGTNMFMAACLFWLGRKSFPVSIPVMLPLMIAAMCLGIAGQPPLVTRLLIAAGGTAAIAWVLVLLRRASS